ncbi:MAG: antibiotic transporter [Verrucomicrobiales bacterium]|nr:antibiotic transporter [Verrucomicrobiales bacterium]
MKNKPTDGTLAAGILFAILLWGGNNAATKYLVQFWPPVFAGCTRFLFASIIMFAMFRYTEIFGVTHPLSRELKKDLWIHGAVNLALYILTFNLALTYTTASHVALYLGTAPIWALLWEGKPDKSWVSVRRYLGAAVAFAGVIVLFLPALKKGSSTNVSGELLALTSSILWTNYGRQCRKFTGRLSGAEISAHTFWRAAILVFPYVMYEIVKRPPLFTTKLVLIQVYCTVASGIVAFALWNNALKYWTTSKVYLFNNLIPLSTMLWAYIFLKEQLTTTFWISMVMIIAGVLLAQLSFKTALPRNEPA